MCESQSLARGGIVDERLPGMVSRCRVRNRKLVFGTQEVGDEIQGSGFNQGNCVRMCLVPCHIGHNQPAYVNQTRDRQFGALATATRRLVLILQSIIAYVRFSTRHLFTNRRTAPPDPFNANSKVA